LKKDRILRVFIKSCVLIGKDIENGVVECRLAQNAYTRHKK